MNISIKNLNNQSGVTLTETLMATAIGVVIIAATFTIFNAQQDSLTSANEELLIHSKGRLAAESLAKDIRLVGFGLPPGAQILSISENSITYRAALSDLQTSIPPGPSGSFAANSGDNNLNVVSANGFADLYNIVIYDPATGDYELASIDGVPDIESDPNSLPLSEPLQNDYKFGLNSMFIKVSQYNTVTIELSGTDINKNVDGGTSVLISDVDSSKGLVLEYFDVNENSTSDVSAVHKIAVSISMIDPDNDRASIDFKTDITLRNIAA